MEELTLAVPGMWADHHVITVREVLANLDGVKSTSASARDLTVHISYDGAATDAQRIAAALAEGGYPTASPEDTAEPPSNKPAWTTAGVRVTTTDPDDLTMSGDHRKY
jgi:copper chaperone CopZ